MRIFDFLFYHLSLWFTKNAKNLSWSTPQERAAYAIAIFAIFWILTFWQIVETVILKNEYYKIQKIPLILSGIVIFLIVQYFYINKNRYDLITSTNYKQFKTEPAKGMTIVVIFGLLSAVLPFALAALINIKHLH